MGYHLPVSCAPHETLMRKMISADRNNNGGGGGSAATGPRALLTFERRLYSRRLTRQEEYKQDGFKEADTDRDNYLEKILQGTRNSRSRTLKKFYS